MPVITRDIPLTTRESIARPVARALLSTTAAPVTFNDPQQWRGNHGLRAAERIQRQVRENISPDMEPLDPDVNDDVPSQDMEPLDATVDDEDEGEEKATVTGDGDAVTITADADETIVAVTGDDQDVYVEIEDDADLLLSP
jgi:hypothetical protein